MAVHITSGAGLLPAAALQPQPDLAPEPLTDAELSQLFEKDLASQAITKIEEALGGRGKLTEELLSSPDLTASIRYVLALVFDPRYDHLPLGKLCQMAGITPGEFFRAFRDAKLAKAGLRAMAIIADGLEPIAKELVQHAVSHQETCPLCCGQKTILVRDKTNRLKKRAKVETANAEEDAQVEKNIRVPCTQCLGTGAIHVRGGLEEKKLALELSGLLKKGPGIVVQQQNNQQNNSVSFSADDGGGGLGALQQAVSLIMQSPRPQPPAHLQQTEPAAPVVDTVVIPPVEDAPADV